MALLTRSESVVVLRYGHRPGGDQMELYDVGMRVDGSIEVVVRHLAEAAERLGELAGLGKYLRLHWEGRLLLADDEPQAQAFAAAHPKALGRGTLRLFPSVTACSAAHAIARAVPVERLQVSFDGGPSYIASPMGAEGVVGSYVPLSEVPEHWTKPVNKTKFKLVRRPDRPAGEGS